MLQPSFLLSSQLQQLKCNLLLNIHKKGYSQLEREHIKKDKGKKAMSPKDAEEVSTESESDDETTHVLGFMVESSKKKEMKKFDFVTESGEHVHFTKEQTSAQKKIKEEVKAKAVIRESETRKEELIDLLGPEVGSITLKVYREDDTSEIIHEFKASDLHLAELRIDLDKPLSEQDPLNRLNDLTNKKRKHADDIHDFFRANKRLKSSSQYKNHPAGTMLNKPVLGMIRLNQYPGLDDHARTFSSLLLAKIDKRNLNPLKQIRVIEQPRK
ncbi:hypothetical protein Tco_1580881 [Tanacetum coccineum]